MIDKDNRAPKRGDAASRGLLPSRMTSVIVSPDIQLFISITVQKENHHL